MLELLVVISILGLLLGLLLAAVVRIREVALRTESTNNLRQIVLAVHQFADAHNGRLPTVGDGLSVKIGPRKQRAGPRAPALFVRILPYIEQGNAFRKGPFPPVSLFLSPADPTAREMSTNGHAGSSYAANAFALANNPRLPTTFVDGTSSTIAFAEHYAKCGNTTFDYWQNSIARQRATFADYGDVVPVTQGTPPVSSPSDPGETFQVAPPVKKCYPLVPQTPHPGGMLVAMADGGVRQIAPRISPTIFWGAVTPKGGELPNLDW